MIADSTGADRDQIDHVQYSYNGLQLSVVGLRSTIGYHSNSYTDHCVQ